MADVNYAAFSFIAKPAITIAKSQSNLILPRASHAPSPSKPLKFAKPRRRRNSLRPKILTKPHSPPEQNPSSAPIAPLEAPLPERNDESAAVVSVQNDRAAEELVLGGASGRSLAVRYGLYFVGALVFQTVLAVWILGNGSSDEKDEALDGLDSDREASLVNGNTKVLGSNVVQLGERIEEIRAMARQARRDEKSENVGDESLSSRSRIGIEREIGNRLKKLQKRLNSNREKFPGLYTRHLSKLGASSEAKKGNESLVFKKKLRFGSSPAELGESPKAKGFGGFEKNNASRGSVVGDKATVLSEGENGDIRKSQNGWKESEGNGTRRENDEKEAGPVRKSGNGVIQESKLGRSSTESAQSETSKASRREKDQVLMEENREAMEESSERPVLSGNRSSRHNEAKKKPVSSKLLDKQPSVGTDMWWLDLPYVLVVLMHQYSDPEGVAGFYTLKLDTEAKNLDEFSYTVAFEDRGDANNFCFVLDSFFEDLGDVKVEILPLSVKELEAAVNSGKWKVIVVRKGQLGLYAGQPFEDIEMALYALVEETQSS